MTIGAGRGAMSMIMQYIRIRDEELATLRRLLAENPDGAFDYADELADGGDEDLPAEQSRSLDTDKTWDAMAFLLHRAGEPAVDVVRGGIRLTDDEWGYGPPRYLTPEQVSRAASDLDAMPFYRLALQFDPDQMTELYPGIWHDHDSLSYLRGWYERLTTFFRLAAADRDGMVIFLT
jgi:hypothetical protein